MRAKKLNKVSVKEYIAIEKETNTKYEYHNGTIYAMAGGTINHATLCGNIFFELETALRKKEKSCRTMSSEAKLKIKANNSFVYPDAMVICGEIKMSDKEKNSVTNPTIIVEVLSK